MIDVLVLADAPFITGERTKEAVNIAVRTGGAFCVKVRHQRLEPRTSSLEIWLVSDDQGRTRRRILREWLLAKKPALKDPSDRLAEKVLAHRYRARRHLNSPGRVLHHLRRRHLAPLPRRVRRQPVEPLVEFGVRVLVKYCPHNAAILTHY